MSDLNPSPPPSVTRQYGSDGKRVPRAAQSGYMSKLVSKIRGKRSTQSEENPDVSSYTPTALSITPVVSDYVPFGRFAPSSTPGASSSGLFPSHVPAITTGASISASSTPSTPPTMSESNAPPPPLLPLPQPPPVASSTSASSSSSASKSETNSGGWPFKETEYYTSSTPAPTARDGYTVFPPHTQPIQTIPSYSAQSSTADGASGSSFAPTSKPDATPVSRPARGAHAIGPARKVIDTPAAANLKVPELRKASERRAPSVLDVKQWQHKSITTILNVTLERYTAHASNWTIVWLRPLADELSVSGHVPLLNIDIAERLLLSRLEFNPKNILNDPQMRQVSATLPARQTAFEYLVSCWKRLMQVRAQLVKERQKPDDASQTTAVIVQLRELIINYVGIVLRTPDKFPQPDEFQTGTIELVAALNDKSILSQMGPLEWYEPTHSLLAYGEIDIFIDDLARHFENDGLDNILGPVVETVVFGNAGLRRPEGIAAGDSAWRQVVAVLELLVSSKPIAAMIPRMAYWNPSGLDPAQFERACLFGPLLRLHIMPRESPEIMETYYTNVEKRKLRDLNSSQASQRTTLTGLQNKLFRVFDKIVRSSPEAREGVLAFFASVLNMNWQRTGSRVANIVASDGFIMNCQAILLRFAEPFMDADYSKLNRVSPTYVVHSSRINLEGQTRLAATSEEVSKWAESLPAPTAPPNFITEIFYLTGAFNHIGLLRVIAEHDQLEGQYFNHRRAAMEAARPAGEPESPLFLQMKKKISEVVSQLYCIETQLLDPDMVFRVLIFEGFVASWLVRIADPRSLHPAVPIELPLPKDIPPTFAALPELLLQDVLSFLVFILRRDPELLHEIFRKELFETVMTFLTSLQYLNNPYLRAKLALVLYQGTDAYALDNRGTLANQLHAHPKAFRFLMKSLLEVYIDAEITGTHTQYWDKFNSRSNVTIVIQEIWTNREHRRRLEEISRDEIPLFIKFINLLMNDTMFMLEEAVKQIGEATEINRKRGNIREWIELPQAEQEDQLTQFFLMKRDIPALLRLAGQNLGLVNRLTTLAKQLFLASEIVNRLAGMVVGAFESLAGPRCSDLKANNEEWGLRPRDLLRDVIQVCVHLGDEPEFIRAVTTISWPRIKTTLMRSYTFVKFHAPMSDGELLKFPQFVASTETMRATIKEAENSELIPEEYLDPIMCSLMKDPVTLPSSKAVVDMATIKAHLLSDPRDPFNRQPLKIEDVVPNTELKSKIQDFVADNQKKMTEVKEKVAGAAIAAP